MTAGDILQTRLVLLCRGAVDWAGADADGPPLSADGLLDAEIAAATLPRFDAAVSSPQPASRMTAEAVAARRQVPLVWRDGLDEIRAAEPPTDASGYAAWVDALFESPEAAPGESLAEGAERLTATLRAVADRYYGRPTLVVSHPVVLLAFRGGLVHAAVQRDQVEAMPDLAQAIVDYVAGRFYLVADFPVRRLAG